MTEMIEFKSIRKCYDLENQGVKLNTLRKVDENDERFKILKKYDCLTTKEYNICIPMERLYLKIIDAEDLTNYFIRAVRNVCFWDGYCIISWWDE
jgi:hypothetical protein